MSLFRRSAPKVAAVLVALFAALSHPSAAVAQQEPSGGDQNQAVAVNTEDGASVFRLAFSIRRVVDGVVDHENLALAYATCTDCQTVALAFQVVIVVGDANYVAPVNQAAAVNDQCAECLTFASATQIVVGVDGPVVFTPEGQRRLAILRRRMAALEERLDQLTPAQLAAEVSSIEQELIDILEEELVPAGEPEPPGLAPGPTTTVQRVTTTTAATSPSSVVSTRPPTTATTATTNAAPEPATTVAGG